MKKSHTWLLLGGGAVALYLLSKQSAMAGQGQQGQGQLPSGGGQGGGYGQPYSGGGSGYSGGIAGMGATRPRFRR